MTIEQDFEVVRPSFFGGSACIFLNASLVIYIVAFASPFWFDYEGSYHLGLWSACYAVPNDEVVSHNSTVAAKSENRWECIEASTWIDNTAPGFENDWLAGVEAILTISLIFHIVTSVSLLYYVGAPSVEKQVSQAIVFGSFCLTFATACFTLTAVVICGVLVTQEDSAVYRSHLSWSYSLAITSTCVVWVCAVALIVEVVRVLAGNPVRPQYTASPTVTLGNHRFRQLQQSIASSLRTVQNEAIERENEAAAVETEGLGAIDSTDETRA